MEVKQRYSPGISLRLELRFISVEFGGKSMPIALEARPAIPTPNPLSSHRPGDWTIARSETQRQRGDQSGPTASIQVFGKDHIRFDTHTVMRWQTQ